MVVDHRSRAVQVTPVPVTATSADGVMLAGSHLAREVPEQGIGLVVAHAFTHHIRHPTTRKLLSALAAESPVVALDMRGHGRSGGATPSATGSRSISTPPWPPRAPSATNG